jgi:hypothetical protein
VGAYPTDKKMHLCLPEGVFANHAVIVTAYIKYHPVTSVSEEICGAECFADIFGRAPACLFNGEHPDIKRTSTVCVVNCKFFNGLLPDQMHLHWDCGSKLDKKRLTVHKMRTIFLSSTLRGCNIKTTPVK